MSPSSAAKTSLSIFPVRTPTSTAGILDSPRWMPLMHIVRNAKSITESKALPKIIARCRQSAARGTDLSQRVSPGHAGRHRNPQDDGSRGIDLTQIREHGRQARGLLKARMTHSACPENEVMNLIFEPGFSTAAEVTEVSASRRSGMEIVVPPA